jgi:transposase
MGLLIQENQAMLYLAIDQHRKQLTVNERNEQGDVLVKRQVSTRWDKVRAYFNELRERAAAHGGFVAILEVCGFNDWLLAMLKEYGCREIVLMQPTKRSKKKTDRRDAQELGELLWINRQRLLAGQRVQGIKRVRIVGAEDRHDRQLTTMRLRLTNQRTQTINRVKQILRRHNLEQQQPTKGIQTKAAQRWLAGLELPILDRLAMDQLLAQWKLCDEQVRQLEEQIAQRCERNPAAQRLGTITGRPGYCSLTLASRIGPIENFPRPRSLANYWGLVPGCRNSGEATKRLGSITKEGSPIARYMLGQLVLHVLRRDGRMRQWHRRIKLRRGSKIARVAVMRRLTTVIWHMLKHGEPYRTGGPPAARGDQPNEVMANDLAAHRQQLRESLTM